MKLLYTFSRILVGLVFVFSGTVKGIDPLGSVYKFEDYFYAFNLEFLIPYAVYLAIIMIAAEFIIGFALIFNSKTKLAIWSVSLFMLFFTTLTLYLAIENPVSDCGCFGDAIIMTNWETFYKNLVISFFTFILFLKRNAYKSISNKRLQAAIITIGLVLIVGLQVYTLNHLPLLDFRPWKVGNKIISDNSTTPPKTYLTYKNKINGEVKEYLSPNYPWQDTVWMSQWEFVDSRVEMPDSPTNDLKIEDRDGNDHTISILSNSEYRFLLIMYYIESADLQNIAKLKDFQTACEANGLSFISLTASLPDVTDTFNLENKHDFNFFFADDISLKTVVRANPGIVLLKKGVVIAKWNHKDLPDYKSVVERYLNKHN